MYRKLECSESDLISANVIKLVTFIRSGMAIGLQSLIWYYCFFQTKIRENNKKNGILVIEYRSNTSNMEKWACE